MSNKFVQTKRLDENRILIENDEGLDITLFANAEVPIDRASLSEVLNISAISKTISDLNEKRFFGDMAASIDKVVLTPDFHKGAGIPVGSVIETHGFVMPKCVGTDICCGMRLLALSITREEFDSISDEIQDELRYTFFEGGRNIPMDSADRAHMLRYGLPGLSGVTNYKERNLWNQLSMNRLDHEIAHTHKGGSWSTRDIWALNDYIEGSGGVSRDSAIASIGGGNHFIEFQYVDEILDRHDAYEWGLKKGYLTIMIHTGSVGIGSFVGDSFMQKAQQLHPHSVNSVPGDFYMLPTEGPHAEEGLSYLSAMGLAANFATVNRLTLGMLAVECIKKVLKKDVGYQLVYDAPHNLIWSDAHNHIHRKGACPAYCDSDDPHFPTGHPVIIPGSMGDASYVLKGHGAVASLCSAPHGAGRISKRGEGRKNNISDLDGIKVVTKIDLKKTRKDIADEYMKTLLEESPSNYKPILPAMMTVADAGMASPVVKLMPLMTVKA